MMYDNYTVWFEIGSAGVSLSVIFCAKAESADALIALEAACTLEMSERLTDKRDFKPYSVVIFILRTRPSILYEKVGKDRVAHVNSFFCETDQAVVVFEVA